MSFDYTSANATDSGQCANAECVDPVISILPVSGSGINVPSYVTITTDIEGAIIRYTTDGTTPDSLSTTYTGPILITNVNTIIKAIAYSENCEPSDIVGTATYTNPPFPFVFSYACDTPDKGGQWGVFAPNGTNDWHWQLQFTLAALTTIKRLELYQLDPSGNWTTGQVWSTDSPITTPLESANPFSCFPLLVFVAAVQQWAAYQSSLGAWAAGTYTWDLYGDQAFPAPASNFFRLDIILADDSRLSQTIGATCTATPPLCPPPAAPSLTPTCGSGGAPAIDAAFTVGLGLSWRLYRSEIGTGDFDQIATGTGTGALQTVTDSGLGEGTIYYYYISVDAVGCGFKDSNVTSALTLIYAYVSVSTNKTIVDPGESFTISWSSIYLHTSVCNGCLAGEIKTPFGCKPGNTSGSQATSEAVCGVYTYEVSGCNPCGTVIDSVQVEVRCTAACSDPQPDIIQIPNSTTYLCSFLDTVNRLCDGVAYDLVCGTPTWDGRLYKNGDCFWRAPSFDLGLQFGCCDFDTNCGPRCGSDITCSFDAGIPAWVLKIEIHLSSGVGPVWFGRKLYGNDPTGIYNKVSGCGPTTITVT